MIVIACLSEVLIPASGMLMKVAPGCQGFGMSRLLSMRLEHEFRRRGHSRTPASS
jgi:hypothetical protein